MWYSAPELAVCEMSLIDEAFEALQQAPYVELRRVECRQEGNRYVLRGTVSSFYLKQLAQSVLMLLCDEDHQVDNRLEVKGPSESAGW